MLTLARARPRTTGVVEGLPRAAREEIRGGSVDRARPVPRNLRRTSTVDYLPLLAHHFLRADVGRSGCVFASVVAPDQGLDLGGG